MNEWEYTMHYLELEKVYDGPNSEWVLQYLTGKELTELGSEGWELVSVIHITKIQSGYPMPFQNVCGIQYIFKRPKR
jgi:hypothetical protein